MAVPQPLPAATVPVVAPPVVRANRGVPLLPAGGAAVALLAAAGSFLVVRRRAPRSGNAPPPA
jgi:hypothetical protein